MRYDEFNQLCRSLPTTTHVVHLGNSHVWKVGGKVFAMGGWAKTEQPAYTFKVADLNFGFLSAETSRSGYRPISSTFSTILSFVKGGTHVQPRLCTEYV